MRAWVVAMLICCVLTTLLARGAPIGPAAAEELVGSSAASCTQAEGPQGFAPAPAGAEGPVQIAQFYPPQVRCCCRDSLNQLCCWIADANPIGGNACNPMMSGCFCRQ